MSLRGELGKQQENNHEWWKKMYIHRNEIETIKSSYLSSDRCKALKKFCNDQGIHLQKYTGHHGIGKNGSWSRAGKVCYNGIYDKVLKDCTPKKSSAFINCFIMHYQTMK
jgi:hypothetical protein